MTNTTEVETTEINKTKKKDIFMVDPRSIIFNAEENPRKFYGTPAEKKELRESIRTNGVEVPLKIMNTPEGPKLIHGFRRMDAVMSLIAEGVDIKYVKCEPVGRGYSEEDALLDHIVLNSGRSAHEGAEHDQQWSGVLHHGSLPAQDLWRRPQEAGSHLGNHPGSVRW